MALDEVIVIIGNHNFCVPKEGQPGGMDIACWDPQDVSMNQGKDRNELVFFGKSLLDPLMDPLTDDGSIDHHGISFSSSS
jgi:hypothetical protein